MALMVNCVSAMRLLFCVRDLIVSCDRSMRVSMPLVNVACVRVGKFFVNMSANWLVVSTYSNLAMPSDTARLMVW